MYPFTYTKATDGNKAMMLYKDNTKFIAGGTNLIDLMKMNVEKPSSLIDINKLDFAKIELLPNGNVLVGSLVRNSDLAYDKTISKKYPVLSQALLAGASPQLRNRAT